MQRQILYDESKMVASEDKNLDPRVRRTRQLLLDALWHLLQTKRFDEISVQDVTERATVNRATFYAHYPDKNALLEATTSARVEELLEQRSVSFDGTCNSAIRKILLGVCDYLRLLSGAGKSELRPLDSHMESAIIATVRVFIMAGLRAYPHKRAISEDMLATTVSWGLYGACREWATTPHRKPAELVMDGVADLYATMIHPA